MPPPGNFNPAAAQAVVNFHNRLTAATATADLFSRRLAQLVGGTGQLVIAFSQLKAGQFSQALTTATRGLLMFRSAAERTVAQFKGFAAAASPHGMQTFNKAWDILAGTIGTLVTPVFAILAAGALTVADLLREKLAPVLPDLAEKFAGFAAAVAGVIEKLDAFAAWLAEHTGKDSVVGGVAREVGVGGGLAAAGAGGAALLAGGGPLGAIAAALAAVAGKLAFNLGAAAAQAIDERFIQGPQLDAELGRGNAARAAGNPLRPARPEERPGGIFHPAFGFDEGPDQMVGPPAPGVMERMLANFQAVVMDMQQGLGGRGRFSGIAEKWMQLQTGGMSPLEQKQFQIWQGMLDFLRMIARDFGKLQPAVGN